MNEVRKNEMDKKKNWFNFWNWIFFTSEEKNRNEFKECVHVWVFPSMFYGRTHMVSRGEKTTLNADTEFKRLTIWKHLRFQLRSRRQIKINRFWNCVSAKKNASPDQKSMVINVCVCVWMEKGTQHKAINTQNKFEFSVLQKGYTSTFAINI